MTTRSSRLADCPPTLVPFDRADMAAIDKLGDAINERWGKLDILATKLPPLVEPDQTKTGKLFIVRENRIVDYRLPD